jgi:hypothetical protein
MARRSDGSPMKVDASQAMQQSCPRCGASLSFEPEDEVVTCRYCGTTCSIAALRHSALAPAARPPASPTVAIVAILGGFLALSGLVAALVLARPREPSFMPSAPSPLPSSPLPSVPPSQACEKAVGCCRAVMSATATDSAQQRSCEAMRALSDADCMQQWKSLRDTARTLGKRCD